MQFQQAFSLSTGISVALLSAFISMPAKAGLDLASMSLEELMDEPITSVSKRLTRLGDAAAAVTVISAADLRRYGITTLPDALKLAPGMEVSRLNSHLHAVSARGFQGVYADKLLVMIDGRTIYEPVFAGVHWSSQDAVLEDIERIEIIRGPGATLWGANAVNGVVNIITKSAADTRGTLLSTAAGNDERLSTTARYGGALGEAGDYRAYFKYFERDGIRSETGEDMQDDWRSARAGFRMDLHGSASDSYMVQGELLRNDISQNGAYATFTPPYSVDFNARSHHLTGHVLGRWTRALDAGSELSLQAFYSHSEFTVGLDPMRADTYDAELQHQFELSAQQTLTWGLGYRLIDDYRVPSTRSWITPAGRSMHLFTGFVQDEIGLWEDRLRFTLAAKLEHNHHSGFEFQPGVRLAYSVSPQSTLWAAVSRAVRIPDRFELGGRVNAAVFPLDPSGSPLAVVAARGTPTLEPEELYAYELGYRIEPQPGLSFELATFYNVYDKLTDFTGSSVGFETDPAPPHVLIGLDMENGPRSRSYGAELAMRWQVTGSWRLSADYSWQHLSFLRESFEFDSPAHMANLRSHVALSQTLEASVALAYRDRLRNHGVDAHLGLDAGLIWHPTASIEASLWGRSLLERQHTEFVDFDTGRQLGVPRSVLLKITRLF